MGSLWYLLRHQPVKLTEHERRWNRQARGESESKRLDRNWTILVQELRVLQTGVQVLVGFLLIVPFQSRFDDVLSGPGIAVYLVTVSAGLAAVVFLLAPIAMHRVLFRHHDLRTVVSTTHRNAIIGLLCLATALGGSAAIVVLAATESAWGAGAAGGAVALLIGRLWIWEPLKALAVDERRDGESVDEPPPDRS